MKNRFFKILTVLSFINVAQLFALVSPQTPELKPISYYKDIQPILEAKCMACHGCNASPCEMKMDSFAALDRGANQKNQAFGLEPFTMLPMRMKDAKSTEEWRQRGFHAVLSRDGTPVENLSNSLLNTIVERGTANNRSVSVDPSKMNNDESDKFYALMKQSRDHGKRSCAKNQDELKDYFEKFPAGGMPLALPGLDGQELATLQAWIAAGSPGPTAEETAARVRITQEEAAAIQKWEDFLNVADAKANETNDAKLEREAHNLKVKLVSRYIYEHVFLSHAVFDKVPGKFYELVRAKSRSGNIEELVTETPMDNQGAPFYYRFKPVTEVIVQKSHMLWKLSDKKMQRIKDNFYSTSDDKRLMWPKVVVEVPYVTKTDVEEEKGTDNPFYNFQQVPTLARARFLLDESILIANGEIRGPVCTGTPATSAIRDHFWKFFANPETDITVLKPDLGATEKQKKDKLAFMMAKDFSDKGSSEFRINFEKTFKELKPNGYNINDLWIPLEQDPQALSPDTATLTVFRHGTSATTIPGARGRITPTLWFLTYANVERIYYNLVPQFKYWDHAQKRVETWQFMRRLRQENEQGFIAWLPPETQKTTLSVWSEGLSKRIKRLVWSKMTGKRANPEDPNSPAAKSDAAVAKVAALFRSKLSQSEVGDEIVLGSMRQWDNINVSVSAETAKIPDAITSVAQWEKALAVVTAKSDQSFAQFLPDALYLKLNTNEGSKLYSFLSYRGHVEPNFSAVSLMGGLSRKVEEDHLTVLPGVVGDFPNLMVELDIEKSAEFLKEISVLNASTLAAFEEKWAMMRHNPNFWKLFADINTLNKENMGDEAGLLDLNYYRGYKEKTE